MKKSCVLACLAVLLAAPSLFAGGDTDKCDTKYPIILAHGAAANEDDPDYWTSVREAIEDEGAEVYVTFVNAFDGTAHKGQQWKEQVLQILAVSGASRVNVIGHSHGTLYTRYAMSNLGIGNYIKSHTSMAGPHRGSAIADIIMGIIPDAIEPAVSWMIGLFFPADDDGNPTQMGYDLTRDYMINIFNPNTPNVSGVRYQSWGCKIKFPVMRDLLELSWAVLLPFEGANDGLVSTTSAQWGSYRETIDGAWWGSGINHSDIKDGLTVNGWDCQEFYVDVVNELKDWGY